jgi:endonuclease/exonuclease/phosphatase family metal-dependent hydrolase
MKKCLILLLSLSFQLFGGVENSIIPLMDSIYQEAYMQNVVQNRNNKLRVMTFNMLYNVKNAEDKLPIKHRWAQRKFRLFEYLEFANADIIGSQELQEDQVEDVQIALGPHYSSYGLKTRENENRTDTNAIFFNTDRLELLEGKTIFYEEVGGNGFSYAYFKDKWLNKKFVVLNTKLSWGLGWQAMKRRMAEATQLSQFVALLRPYEPILLMGDFNTLYFLDGKSIMKTLTQNCLNDSETTSIFGHFGPFCSINNSVFLKPFVGPELKGFILDRILVNDQISVVAHGIDTAKINGEFPSDHFPVIVDIVFNP